MSGEDPIARAAAALAMVRPLRRVALPVIQPADPANDNRDDDDLPPRPRTRAECHPDGGGPWSARPCPWAGCRHHIGLDLDADGTTLRSGVTVGGHKGAHLLKTASKHQANEFAEAVSDAIVDAHETCALDVADRGGITLDQIGKVFRSLTRERIRQIETRAILKVKKHSRPLMAWKDHVPRGAGSSPLAELAEDAAGFVDES
jgi:hypothetical protein